MKNEESLRPDGNSSFFIPHSSFLKHIALVHVTPSGEGLRLVFVMPEGEDLEGAQRWMAAQLEVEAYDKAVKDYARASFAVPEEYILYIDEEKLFNEESFSNEELRMKNEESASHVIPTEVEGSLDCAQEDAEGVWRPLHYGRGDGNGVRRRENDYM